MIVIFTGRAGGQNNRDKSSIFKTCLPWTDCISEINNTRIDNAKIIDVFLALSIIYNYLQRVEECRDTIEMDHL